VIAAGTLRHVSYLTYFLDVQSSGKLIVESQKAPVCLSVYLCVYLTNLVQSPKPCLRLPRASG
jgi:hypothetical protein